MERAFNRSQKSTVTCILSPQNHAVNHVVKGKVEKYQKVKERTEALFDCQILLFRSQFDFSDVDVDVT